MENASNLLEARSMAVVVKLTLGNRNRRGDHRYLWGSPPERPDGPPHVVGRAHEQDLPPALLPQDVPDEDHILKRISGLGLQENGRSWNAVDHRQIFHHLGFLERECIAGRDNDIQGVPSALGMLSQDSAYRCRLLRCAINISSNL